MLISLYLYFYFKCQYFLCAIDRKMKNVGKKTKFSINLKNFFCFSGNREIFIMDEKSYEKHPQKHFNKTRDSKKMSH